MKDNLNEKFKLNITFDTNIGNKVASLFPLLNEN